MTMAIKGMMKKRHVQVRDYSPINALPTEQIEVDHGGQNNEHFGRKQTRNHTKLTKWAPRCVVISILFFGMLGFRNSMETLHDLFIKPNDRLLYGPPSNATTKFTSLFEDMLTSDKTLGRGDFVPLVLDNGKLLCRRRHKRQISWFRSRMFINMVREGLKSKNPPNYGVDGGLPIIMIEGDYPFCNVAEKKDDIQIPRLAWSMLSPKHGNWCKAISIPSYESWFSYHRTYKSESDWIRTFQQNEKKYPWFGKIDKAVWRGSSTYEISQFGQSAFSEIPRARLVKESMENPDLIDAGFTKINQKFASDKKVLASETNVAKSVWFKDMMKYKAVIDIDGNNWSSRFGMLLCMNSVVIKIDPDFIEYFYKDLKPMVHYIPATIENLTEATAYVMDKNYEQKMKDMVKSANSWCQRTLIEKVFIDDAMIQIDEYSKALDGMNNNWQDEWKHVKNRFTSSIDDLVDCEVRNIVSYFID